MQPVLYVMFVFLSIVVFVALFFLRFYRFCVFFSAIFYLFIPMPSMYAVPSMRVLYSPRCSPCKTPLLAACASCADNRLLLIVDGVGCAPGVADTGTTSGLSAGLELAVASVLATGVSAGSALNEVCLGFS